MSFFLFFFDFQMKTYLDLYYVLVSFEILSGKPQYCITL